MSTSISKKDIVVLFLGWTLTLFSVVILYKQGVERSYFHQDDVVELGVVADWQGWSTLGVMNNEHLNVTFWPLLRLQWMLFGISYTPYLMMNIILHVIVLTLIFLITYRQTKSLLWSSVPVWAMVINANWFTVVWWITGQMIFLTTIFALISYLVILMIKDDKKNLLLLPLLYIFSVLPGMSWGVGLTWPVWPMLIFGIDYQNRRINAIGKSLLLAQITLVFVYFSLVGKGLSVHTDPRTWLSNPLAILNFAYVGIRNTLIGRWLWPLEDLSIRAMILISTLITFLFFKPFKWINQNVWFGFLVVFGSFVTFAIPRWQFGIDHAMANYYAYFPLPFLLISVSVLMSRMSLVGIKKCLVIFVVLVHIPLSWIGFEWWARVWVMRPQQTRDYFAHLDRLQPDECITNEYLPMYIVPQNIWRIDYIWPIFKKDFNPFCSEDYRIQTDKQ